MADVKEKFDALVQQYPTYQESNTTSVSTQTAEGEIKYSQEELDQIVAELEQINEEAEEQLQAAEKYVSAIYDNGNLDESSQEVLTEIKQDMEGQRAELGESLTGLKDFLNGVKDRFVAAEARIKTKLAVWLNKFQEIKRDVGISHVERKPVNNRSLNINEPITYNKEEYYPNKGKMQVLTTVDNALFNNRTTSPIRDRSTVQNGIEYNTRSGVNQVSSQPEYGRSFNRQPIISRDTSVSYNGNSYYSHSGPVDTSSYVQKAKNANYSRK